MGPYGGYLADGSEYSGSYGLPADADGAGEGPRMTVGELVAFHREQVAVLASSGAELRQSTSDPLLVTFGTSFLTDCWLQ